MPVNIDQHEGKKYKKLIWGLPGTEPEKGPNGMVGVWIDVYSVGTAFGVSGGPQNHALKKILMPGRRNKGSVLEDVDGILAAVHRWREELIQNNALREKPPLFGRSPIYNLLNMMFLGNNPITYLEGAPSTAPPPLSEAEKTIQDMATAAAKAKEEKNSMKVQIATSGTTTAGSYPSQLRKVEYQTNTSDFAEFERELYNRLKLKFEVKEKA